MDVDVVVVGGGLAGLTAALRLQQAGTSVVVLEARDRVGGRTYTVEHEGKSIDLGGAYVGPTQNRVLRLIKELGLETYDIYDNGKSLIDVTGKVIEVKDIKLPPLGILSLLDLNKLLIETDALADTVIKESPHNSPNAEYYDNMSVKEWVHKQSWTEEGKRIYEIAVKVLFCAETSEISMLYWLWYVKGGDCVNRLILAKDGAQEKKVVGGTQQISNKLATTLNVLYSSQVDQVNYESEGSVLVKLTDNREFKGKYCVMAIPPSLWTTIKFTPILPGIKRQISQRMPMGCIIKTITYFKKPYWREKGYRGQIACSKGPITASYDDCKPDGSKFALMGFILANHARAYLELTQDQRKELVCQQYAEYFKSPEMLECVSYHEHNWAEEPFSGGCYVGYMTPSTMTQVGSKLREPLQNIHFAGTETATEWPGYMDGAIQSGERVANEIQLLLSRENSKIKAPTPWEQCEKEEKQKGDVIPVLDVRSQWWEKALPSVPVFVFMSTTIIASLTAFFVSKL